MNTIHSIIKNIFAALCFAITLLLIYQLFITFMTEKPTTTTKIEKELTTNDLPIVSVCLDPGFRHASATKYGYHVSFYWAGLVNAEKESGIKNLLVFSVSRCENITHPGRRFRILMLGAWAEQMPSSQCPTTNEK